MEADEKGRQSGTGSCGIRMAFLIVVGSHGAMWLEIPSIIHCIAEQAGRHVCWLEK